DEVRGCKWEKGGLADGEEIGNGNEQHPVLNVTAEEAHRFARWLGGELPTAQQWDKAAGRFEDYRGDGPFKGKIGTVKPGLDVAVGRKKEGPMPVGAALRDESLFGCRDMAGNGREWTCTNADPGRSNQRVAFPVADPKVRLQLRGRSYAALDPY